MNLKNRVIISTRPENGDDNLTTLLKNEGAEVISFPLIKVSTVIEDQKTKTVIEKISDYNWIIFTSKNGVNSFFELLTEAQGDKSLPDSIKFAVVGKKTGESLIEKGYNISLTGSGNTSKELLSDLLSMNLPSETKILLVLGNLAPDLLESNLSNYFQVNRIDVYKTTPPDKLDDSAINYLVNDSYDLIIFTSPSGFENYISLCSGYRIPEELRIACIGPTTAKAVNEKGITPVLTAKTSTAEGLYKSISEYFNNKCLTK